MAERSRFRMLGRIIGVLFLLAAIVWLAEEIAFGERSQPAAAVVVSYARSRRGNGKAVVEFDVADQVVKAPARTIFYFEPKPGDRTPIRYRTNDPTDARIDTFEQRYLMALIILGIAVLWNGGRILGWIRRTKHEPS